MRGAFPLLARVSGPADLRGMSLAELEALCRELRECIIQVVADTGGHLAPSLGVVELTVALHALFDAPRDKILWDVGHQAYAHKILTGRRDLFPTLRQRDGLSGFTCRAESPCDPFGAGHASTAISAALGFAKARDLLGEAYRVIAVVGDGALTGGMAYEGLNNAGAAGTDLTVILNDNRMSIAPNVGAMARYLTGIITNPTYNKVKAEIWNLTGRMRSIGPSVRLLARRLEESLKNLITPGMLFEELGFRYIGPVDGHDLGELLATLRAVREMRGPTLVHCLTIKGKGYLQAEQNPDRFHGVDRFDKVTGRSNGPNGGPRFTTLFGEALVEAAARDPRVVAITAAMPEGTGLQTFRERFPDRFFDVGIAEQHAVTFAAGLAAAGARPVVAIYSTFLQRAYDQIIHDVALQRLPVVFVLDRAGVVGADGPTHHGAFDLAYLSCIPHMVVAAPRDGAELRDLLVTALQYEQGPVAIRFPRVVAPVGVTRPPHPVLIGSWEVLSEGEEGILIAVGACVPLAEEAAGLLRQDGISVGVVNARFVKPIDRACLDRLTSRTPLLVTIEEGTLIGGLGGRVLQWVHEMVRRPCRVHSLGLPDHFLPHGPRGQVLEEIGLHPEGIRAVVHELIRTGAAVTPPLPARG